MSYDMGQYIQQQSEGGDTNYYVHLALQNNERLSDVAWKMLNLTCELEETLPELTPKTQKLFPENLKRQNEIFYQFRDRLRLVVNASWGAVLYNKPTTEDKELVKQIESYIGKPYGTYPINKLTSPAREYFQMLQGKGILPLSFGFSQESGISKFNKS